jgi:hypothetical protein
MAPNIPPAREVGRQAGAELVALACPHAALVVAAPPHARTGDGDDGGRDADLVHLVERDLRRPALVALAGKQRGIVGEALEILGRVARRVDVVMHVDQARRRRLAQRRERTQCGARTGGRCRGEEAAARLAAGARGGQALA